MIVDIRPRPAPARRLRSTSPVRWLALGAAAGVLLASCTSGSQAAVTVTSASTVTGGAARGTAGATGVATSATTRGSTAPPSASGGTTPSSTTAKPTTVPPGGQPDGFVPVKLKPGQQPPQFVVVSFDGIGWNEKWQYWKAIEDRVPFHFTGFLSGTYLLSQQTRTKYTGPGRRPGAASISFPAAADVPVEIADLNDALDRGDEIGTHFVGHFCSYDPPGGDVWDTGDWNEELNQFFTLVKNVKTNNGLATALDLPAGEIKGERTPCLEGNKADLYPALQAHGMTYDASFTRDGLYWPTRTSKYTKGGYRIWEIGMSQFPIEGPVLDHPTHHKQITMDYNFYYSQRHASSDGVTPAQSAKDSAQVLATYNAMFDAVHTGNRAPLILGNHFEAWNNNAYTKALGNFVLARCGQPDVECVPFRDLIAWMDAQDPAVLAQLQARLPEFGQPSS